MDRLEAIERLAQLKESGILTAAEFEEQKRHLLNNTTVAAASSPSAQLPSYHASNHTHDIHFHARPHFEGRAQMRYDAAKKSVLLAYVFWFFFFSFGIHRFYMHKWKTALLLMIFSAGFWFALFGSVAVGQAMFGQEGTVLALPVMGLWILTWLIWFIADAVLIPRWVRTYNYDVANSV